MSTSSSGTPTPSRDPCRCSRPAGTPSTIVAKLNRDIVAVLRTPEIAERLSSQGAEAIGNTEFASYIKSETAKWARVVRESGAKAE